MQNIKKTNEPIPRKVRYERTDWLTDGREFIGPFRLKTGGPIMVNNWKVWKIGNAYAQLYFQNEPGDPYFLFHFLVYFIT